MERTNLSYPRHRGISTFPASQYMYIIYIYTYIAQRSSIYDVTLWHIFQILQFIYSVQFTHHTHTEYIHLYIYTHNVMFIIKYHVRCLAQRTCIMHHFLIRCHRAKVAMLTAKIESTMPRPQRTALNEAPSCLVFG